MYMCLRYIILYILDSFHIDFAETLLVVIFFYDNTIDFLSTRILNSEIAIFSIKTWEYKIVSTEIML